MYIINLLNILVSISRMPLKKAHVLCVVRSSAMQCRGGQCLYVKGIPPAEQGGSDQGLLVRTPNTRYFMHTLLHAQVIPCTHVPSCTHPAHMLLHAASH